MWLFRMAELLSNDFRTILHFADVASVSSADIIFENIENGCFGGAAMLFEIIMSASSQVRFRDCLSIGLRDAVRV